MVESLHIGQPEVWVRVNAAEWLSAQQAKGLQAVLQRAADKYMETQIEAQQVRWAAGWSLSALKEAVENLHKEGFKDQAAVIKACLERPDGYVDRRTAEDLTGRQEGGVSFRGFTKPVVRITRQLQFEGDVHEDAAPLLAVTYSGGAQASGFVVPTDLANMWVEARQGVNQ